MIKSTRRSIQVALAAIVIAGAGWGCSTYTTQRDKTVKGGAIGAVAGAAGAVIAGEREADRILVGAGIGAVAGAAVGAYMDAQEEKLARIPNTTVEQIGDGLLLVRFDSDVLFNIDSALLSDRARATLLEVAAVLQEYNRTAVVVQGFTDSTGSEEHNQRLSQRRAESVQNYFIGRGIAGERMTAVGYGEDFPVASNATASGRQLNRRVTILLKANVR